MRMEEFSGYAIQDDFLEELKNGQIEWRAVNMQLPENQHFVKDFQLRMSSLIIVRFKDGKQVEWRNLEKIWDHVGDMNDFVKYVQSNVKAFLKAK
jgi:pyrroloquinoline quinone (PQQ) biosynthesis protein C